MLSFDGIVKRPYPGLRPFEVGEAEIFFGRESHVDRLLEILNEQRFLAVLGPSGSGKSSLVRAGLLPALAAGYLGTGSDWRFLVLRPGDRPLARLAAGLLSEEVFGRELGGEPEARKFIDAELARGPRALIDIFHSAARRVAHPEQLNLMVLVDQFEELFSYAWTGDPQSDESEAFVNLLLAPRAEPGVRIHVVLTMRTDFLGDCTRFLQLPEAINHALFLTPRLTRDEMRTAIDGPPLLFGGSVEGEVVAKLINGVGGVSDQLPILQHALSQMWEHAARMRESKIVTVADLDAVGGVEHALAEHADTLLDTLSPRQQQLAERLFRAITERTSAEDGSRIVRRPRRLEEIAASIGGCPWQDLVPVVEMFSSEGANFLTYVPPLGPRTVIDISHEALIRKWERLQRWVEAEAKQGTEYRRWRDRALKPDDLLGKGELARAMEWRAGEGGVPPDPAWASRYGPPEDLATTLQFIEESEEAAKRAEQERLDRQLQEARARRQRVLLLVISVFSLVLFGVAVLALDQKRQAQKAEAQARRAESKTRTLARLINESQKYASIDPDRAQLLAREAYREQPFSDTESLIRAVGLRHAALRNTYRPGRFVHDAAFSPDAKTVLTARTDGGLQLLDVHTGHPSKTFSDGDDVRRVEFSAGGHTLMTVTSDGIAQIQDARTYQKRVKFDVGMFLDASLSPDGKIVLATIVDDSCDIWDASTGRPLGSLRGHTDAIYDTAFSPDGKRIVTASADKTARIWDVQTRRLLVTLTGHSSDVLRANFSPDGQTVVTAGADTTARLWHVETGKEMSPELRHSGNVLDASFSPHGRTIATAGADGIVRLWDAKTGTVLSTLEGHRGPVRQVEFSRDGRTLLTVGNDNTVRRWAVMAEPRIMLPEGPSALSRDGRTIITAGDSGPAQLWSVDSGRLLQSFQTGSSPVTAVVFSPDGRALLIVSDKTQLWGTDGTLKRTLEGASERIAYAEFSRDGTMFVTAGLSDVRIWFSNGDLRRLVLQEPTYRAIFSPDGATLLTLGVLGAKAWDVLTGRLKWESAQFNAFDAEFSRDGKRIVAAAFQSEARVLDSGTGRPLAVLRGHTGSLRAVFFDPDATTVVTAGYDGTARLWHAATGGVRGILEGHRGPVMAAAFSPDGKTVLTAGVDGTARLWDAASARLLLTLTAPAPMRHAAFSPDGRTVMTVDQNGTKLWDVSAIFLTPAQLADAIRRRVGRELTPEERLQSGLPSN
jgi:WD40 repeat protein